MRNALIVALGLVCAALVLSGPTDAQNVKTVQVTGTVDVGNLPIDPGGRVSVSAVLAPPTTQFGFIGLTRTRTQGFGPLRLGKICAVEFPRSRVCEGREVLETTPAPALSEGAWVWFDRGDSVATRCVNPDGVFLTGCGVLESPVACCGLFGVGLPPPPRTDP